VLRWSETLERDDRQEHKVADLEKGITEYGAGYAGKSWNILGQVYLPKATCESTFAFETNTEPGQFVPVHIHPTQDEFILVLEGVLDLKLDGKWVQAKVGDLVRLPRGIPHGYFNKSDRSARALFWDRLRGCLNNSSTISTMSPIRPRW
jgi:quercetin dioxygenase-like cupin family protein